MQVSDDTDAWRFIAAFEAVNVDNTRETKGAVLDTPLRIYRHQHVETHAQRKITRSAIRSTLIGVFGLR
ncbi:MAG TPA: hypothetical protein VF534_24945 [Paraburkholderia sp.]